MVTQPKPSRKGPTSRLELTGMALGVDLAQELRRRRADGQTIDALAAWIQQQGIQVSREMVRRWCTDLGIEGRPEAEAAS